MFTFIKESRAELRDTQEEIEKEQAVLKDTSDLLEKAKEIDNELQREFSTNSALDKPVEVSREKSEEELTKEEEKAKRREEKAERKRLEKERRKSEEALNERRGSLKIEREKSAPLLATREQSEIEKETSELMKEFITRQATDVEEKKNFEEALMRKLAKKKNPHALEADKLMKQQAWAEEAIDREKAAYEAKMMEKLKSRREKSGLVSREASSLNEPASASEPVDVKPKKEKKKKKSKDKDKDEEENIVSNSIYMQPKCTSYTTGNILYT
ncbi:hypothetical protein EB796_001104 [Bugula neritina]|uniref:Uncharacterized protein n=1 Tax=Bugula neritina TaxID=10212 RepID=A0A7J7KQY4_BUGNE|nr:hypothetical protein EB796_001104 [Bugula neritina]